MARNEEGNEETFRVDLTNNQNGKECPTKTNSYTTRNSFHSTTFFSPIHRWHNSKQHTLTTVKRCHQCDLIRLNTAFVWFDRYKHRVVFGQCEHFLSSLLRFSAQKWYSEKRYSLLFIYFLLSSTLSILHNMESTSLSNFGESCQIILLGKPYAARLSAVPVS